MLVFLVKTTNIQFHGSTSSCIIIIHNIDFTPIHPILTQLSNKTQGVPLDFFKLDNIVNLEKNLMVYPRFWFKKCTQMGCNGLKSILYIIITLGVVL